MLGVRKEEQPSGKTGVSISALEEHGFDTKLGAKRSSEAIKSEEVVVRTSSISPAVSEKAVFENSGVGDASHVTGKGHYHQLSLSEVIPVDIGIRDLSVDVDVSLSAFSATKFTSRFLRGKAHPRVPETKSILRNINIDMPRGTLTAIIGGSGSGKTSLLNTMAERVSSEKLSIRGSTTFNGAAGIESIRSAYVVQQDILLPTLTVRETLRYSADIRLPPPTTADERKRIVEEVISELGLKDCANTRIGTSIRNGCSGGEKRRTSIGVQLLSNPSVLFLDEPTTGLDATSAFQLVKTLKKLASRGRTIVASIHQPRSEIWDLVDRLVILTRGSPVYSGEISRCLPYFQSHGIQLPAFVNPAEFLIDIAAIDNRSPELEVASTERVETLKNNWLAECHHVFDTTAERSITLSTLHQSSSVLPNRRSVFTRQLRVLTERTFTVTLRDPMGMVGSILQAVAMGIITGWIFLALGSDQAGIRSREGALHAAATLQGYLLLIFETYRMSVDIQLFDRERQENVVDIVPFLLSRRCARLLVEDLPVPLLFSTIFYWMAGFEADAAQFLTFFAIALLNQYIAVAFGTMCVALDRSFAGASMIANVGYTLQSLSSGYLIQSNSLPIWIRWLKWIGYIFYSFGALCANEFTGKFYDCHLVGGESNPACAQYTGTYIMESLGLPQNWIIRPILILLAYAIMFYVLAAFILKVMPVKISIAQSRSAKGDSSAGKQEITARSLSDFRTVEIGLEGFSLELEQNTAWGRKLPTKTILNPITATFKPGLLNVIIGPSGSGKTSLLNSMALRSRNSIGKRYRTNGKMTFNGAVPSDSVLRSVCAYVCQDDDALLPSLTVRETLRFAAGLRLPSHMSTDEKHCRAEAILLKMGLKDCADNVIGNDLMKGISGGEKRRVTIAVQILTDSRVLLLDEPTSGLDAFTANSIIEVLRGLAAEGRTLILSIHQARSDLFHHFGSILLLARGGSPCYTGPASGMLPYFSSLGYQCPTNTNPADFAIDLISIDLQHIGQEQITRQKVQDLVTSWASINADTSSVSATIATPAELGALKRRTAKFRVSYPILVHRAIINLRRRPELLMARIGQNIGLSILITIFFSPLGNTYSSVQNRVGFLLNFCSFYFVGMLQNVAVFPGEKAVFDREHEDRAYSVEAFFMQYTTCEIPFEVTMALISAALIVAATGMPRTLEMFFVFFFNSFCIVSCGESIGLMFNSLFTHTDLAAKLTGIMLSVALTMSGIQSVNMPSFLKGVNYLSPCRYAIRNLAPYSLHSMVFTCNDYQRLPNGQCTISTGLEVLQLFDLDVDPLLNILALGACTLLYRLVAYLLLKGKKSH